MLQYLHSLFLWRGSDGKESTCNAGDLGLILGSGRSSGEGHGYLFQYSGLENSMDRGAWWATVHWISKSQTWLTTNTSTFSLFLWRGKRLFHLPVKSKGDLDLTVNVDTPTHIHTYSHLCVQVQGGLA